MNPYLEQDDVWTDFHNNFITDIHDELVQQLRPNYVVKTEHALFIRELPEDQWQFFGRADVAVADPHATSSGNSAAVIAAPAFGRIPIAVDIERHAYVEIRDRNHRRLITVIELLSPTNKYSGPDREQYIAKRNQLLLSNVHLVEIDLLRGGPRLPVQDLPECDYLVLVSRWNVRPKVDLWPLRLTDALPTVPIPVHVGTADATLDLKKLLDYRYDRSGLADHIYLETPKPALTADQMVWAKQFLPRSSEPAA